MEDGEGGCRKIIQNDALHTNKFNYGYLMPSQSNPLSLSCSGCCGKASAYPR